MKFQLQQAVEILSRTPTVLRTMLSDLSEPWIHNNYGEKTFSPFDVVGHLIHGERTDWLPRARIILAHGRDQPFEPFDRYAQFEAGKGKTIADLLDEFESLRARNIADLKALGLTPQQFKLQGTHPELGRVTLGALLATWVTHDLNHIAQIAKALAFQYREHVGPWLKYSSILRPPQPA